jgi:hypothetical protein
MSSRFGPRLSLLTALTLLGLRPCLGQTVIRDSAPPPTRDSSAKAPRDSSAKAPRDSTAKAPRDTATMPAPATAAAPPPAIDPHPKGICTAEVPASGGEATDLLLVSFLTRSAPSDREAAIKAVKGEKVTADPADPAAWYVRVPSGGNEFALRSIADRLIRARAVKEVGPVQCPARP